MTNTWMWINVRLPAEDGKALLQHLEQEMGFLEVDYAVLQRPDRSQVNYAPCPRRTSSGYTIDPFGDGT